MARMTVAQLRALEDGKIKINSLFDRYQLISSGLPHYDVDDEDENWCQFTASFSMTVDVEGSPVELSYSLTFERSGMGNQIVDASLDYIEDMEGVLDTDDDDES